MPSGLVTPAAGGGSGAVVYLSAAANPLVTSHVVPFDTVDFDTGGFFFAAGHGFKVPVGKAGWYRFSAVVAFAEDAGSTGSNVLLNFGAEPVLFSPFVIAPRIASLGQGIASAITAQGQFAVGDVVDCRATWDGTASPAVGTASQFACEFLGAA